MMLEGLRQNIKHLAVAELEHGSWQGAELHKERIASLKAYVATCQVASSVRGMLVYDMGALLKLQCAYLLSFLQHGSVRLSALWTSVDLVCKQAQCPLMRIRLRTPLRRWRR